MMETPTDTPPNDFPKLRLGKRILRVTEAPNKKHAGAWTQTMTGQCPLPNTCTWTQCVASYCTMKNLDPSC
jgi:hypothetical protein